MAEAPALEEIEVLFTQIYFRQVVVEEVATVVGTGAAQLCFQPLPVFILGLLTFGEELVLIFREVITGSSFL